MPIEIKELHIKITVDERSSTGQAKSGMISSKEKQKLIDQCIEQVMEVLEQKKER